MAWEVNNVIAALCVIATMSVVFKDNIFFKIVQRAFVGITLGITIVMSVNVIIKNGLIPITKGEYFIIPATILGLMMLTRFSEEYSWISRYPVVIITGVSLGVFTRSSIQAQLLSSVNKIASTPIFTANIFNTLGNLYAFLGFIGGLMYFIFATEGVPKQIKPIYDLFSKFGRYTIMVFLGVSYGITVLGREVKLLERVYFVLQTFGIVP